MERRIKIGIWLIVAFCAMALSVKAQDHETAVIDSTRLTYEVTGDVRDASTGRRLQYVNVRVSGKKFATVTNADGGFTIHNVDATVIAQAPKMRPHIDMMRKNIADALEIPVQCVNVKATTEEKLGFTGEGLGISAQAVALVDG